MLRRWPADLYEKMEQSDSKFTTTMFVLISAVLKISRVMKMPEGLLLYRGMGGLMDLPDAFFHADAKGRKGFVEWGFMSTTSDPKVEWRVKAAVDVCVRVVEAGGVLTKSRPCKI